MLKYLLDTNIVIYTVKNKPALVRDAFTRHHGQIAISTVTMMELVYGAERSAQPERNLETIEGFAARVDLLDFDERAAAHAAQIRADLAAKGTPIGPYDTMIAGHARSIGLVLVTNDQREFKRVAGLQLENWATPYRRGRPKKATRGKQ